MEAKYSVGDVVRIRDADIMRQLDKEGNVLAGWNSLMEEWCGQAFIVERVIENEYPIYKFKDMSSEMDEWTWTEDMFDPVEEDPKLEEEFLNVIGI